MVNPKKQQSVDERKLEDVNRVDESNDDGFGDSSSSVGASTSAISSVGSREDDGGSGGVEVGLTERLTDILVEEGDGDLLLQQSGREDRVMQWLLALDLQVMGACRADERLKPLLKQNVSSGAAEDRLLAHLSHHFEPSEVGMLARCLCVPLVSIRAGKINKQGTLLCPTAIRGNLNLTLLPTSDLRISFIGDDGRAERLSTLSSDSQCSAVAVEDIPADNSGRSFLIKIPDGEVFYFWCAEKSKLLGLELLSKMKDLLQRKPSLAELTGISDSRLDCFATHLRTYLIGSTVTNTSATAIVSLSSSPEITSGSSELGQTGQSASASLKASRSRPCGGSQAAKTNSPYQISLHPRSSSLKEGPPRNLSSLRSLAREKLKQHGDSNLSSFDNNPYVFPEITTDASSSNHSEKDKLSQTIESHLFSSSSSSEPFDVFAAPPFLGPESQVPLLGSSLISPYYCWCPPVVSTLQYTVAPSQLPITSSESLFLPPLASLLPATRSSSVEIPPMDFPPFLPETLVRLPLSMPSSQQIPTFIPLMCDPIVHIPVIDVCSSGQGYLVSAGPAISTSIPPLYPNLVSPLIPEADSMVEKSARETLRLLISGSSQSNPQFLSGGDEKQSIFVGGSRSLYCGVTDVGAIANSIAAMGLVSLSERSVGADLLNRSIGQGNLADQLEKSCGPGGSCSEDEGPIFSELHDERGGPIE